MTNIPTILRVLGELIEESAVAAAATAAELAAERARVEEITARIAALEPATDIFRTPASELNPNSRVDLDGFLAGFTVALETINDRECGAAAAKMATALGDERVANSIAYMCLTKNNKDSRRRYEQTTEQRAEVKELQARLAKMEQMSLADIANARNREVNPTTSLTLEVDVYFRNVGSYGPGFARDTLSMDVYKAIARSEEPDTISPSARLEIHKRTVARIPLPEQPHAHVRNIGIFLRLGTRAKVFADRIEWFQTDFARIVVRKPYAVSRTADAITLDFGIVVELVRDASVDDDRYFRIKSIDGNELDEKYDMLN